MSATPPPPREGRVRLDKWLWAARLYKTRAVAKTAIDAGHVRIDGQRARASRDVAVGMMLVVRQGHDDREVVVRGLSDVRTAATLAQTLYEETAESAARRAEAAALRRAAADAAGPDGDGRPTKRQRRLIHRFKQSWS